MPREFEDQKQLHYVTIVLETLKTTELNLFDLAFLDMVSGLAKNPKFNYWAVKSRQAYADDIGVSKRWVNKTVKKLNNLDWLELSDKEKDDHHGKLRTTQKYYDQVIVKKQQIKKIESGNKVPQNKELNRVTKFPSSVNKVPLIGKQSSPPSYNYKNNNINNKKEKEIYKEKENLSTLKDWFKSEMWLVVQNKVGKEKTWGEVRKLRPTLAQKEKIVFYFTQYPKYYKYMKSKGEFVAEMQDPERVIKHKRFEDEIPDFKIKRIVTVSSQREKNEAIKFYRREGVLDKLEIVISNYKPP